MLYRYNSILFECEQEMAGKNLKILCFPTTIIILTLPQIQSNKKKTEHNRMNQIFLCCFETEKTFIIAVFSNDIKIKLKEALKGQ